MVTVDHSDCLSSSVTDDSVRSSPGHDWASKLPVAEMVHGAISQRGSRGVTPTATLRLLKAKFHSLRYLVADRSEAGRRPVRSCKLAASELDDRPNFRPVQVCGQLRTCLRPDSVMEFGLDHLRTGLRPHHVMEFGLNGRCNKILHRQRRSYRWRSFRGALN